ncbi:predicted protein [Nematostella vectensis]|uniref:Coronin n=1 Tax=Nematostella vectensis TaxID=45351 RepID=A7T7K5_NEMVE|nr:predicted protein [Nematostella vectensis]|eukprot:XP_001620146.1 hypothetical protein NEMVEDRAFT_v1g223413 [Nematostella vectensis]
MHLLQKSKSTNETISHTGAVLDLSWNHNVRNVLASASADHSVILWDLNPAKAVHVLGHHKDKVQSLEFHPYEPQSLLTGSFDKRAKVVDCRSPESNIKSWKFNGEVERVIWNHFSPFNFLTRNGMKKLIGGDAWRVHLTGPASFAPTVIDNEDGTYDILFVPMEPGKYPLVELPEDPVFTPFLNHTWCKTSGR